ncbi:MAG: hypothetical protein ACLFVJ_16095 [Persicimonas sp.]
MHEAIIPAVLYATLFFGMLLFGRLYERSQHADFDINEGREPALDTIPALEDLRTDPRALSRLKGKISAVGIAPKPPRNYKMPEGIEPYVVDTNGVVHTLETTTSFGDQITLAKFHRSQAEIVEHARWLAATLGVDFQDR